MDSKRIVLIEAFDVATFCETHNLSRAKLYQLWAENNGPARMKIGRKTLISREAAASWRRQLTAAGPDAVETISAA